MEDAATRKAQKRDEDEKALSNKAVLRKRAVIAKTKEQIAAAKFLAEGRAILFASSMEVEDHAAMFKKDEKTNRAEQKNEIAERCKHGNGIAVIIENYKGIEGATSTKEEDMEPPATRNTHSQPTKHRRQNMIHGMWATLASVLCVESWKDTVFRNVLEQVRVKLIRAHLSRLQVIALSGWQRHALIGSTAKNALLRVFMKSMHKALLTWQRYSWTACARRSWKWRDEQDKTVLRMGCGIVYKAWRSWEADVKDLRHQRSLREKMAWRMRNVLVYSAFAKKRLQASQMGKVLFRMHSMCVGRAMSTWDRATGEHRRQRCLLDKVLATIRHRCVHTAWESWVNGSKELRRQRNMLDKLTMRMRSVLMYKALATWRHNSNELRRQRCLLDKVALRMRSVGMMDLE